MIDYDVYILFSYSPDRMEMYYYKEPITIRIVIPFKDQIAANAVCRQLVNT